MTKNPSAPKSAADPEIVEVSGVITIEDICISCRVEPEWVNELVAHGVIAPVGGAQSGVQFTAVSLMRVAKARRLDRDLQINVPGIALALDLLEELEALRKRLNVLEGRRREQDEGD